MVMNLAKFPIQISEDEALILLPFSYLINKNNKLHNHTHTHTHTQTFFVC